MVGLLEPIVGRVADILENVRDELDKLSECLFTENSKISSDRPDNNISRTVTGRASVRQHIQDCRRLRDEPKFRFVMCTAGTAVD